MHVFGPIAISALVGFVVFAFVALFARNSCIRTRHLERAARRKDTLAEWLRRRPAKPVGSPAWVRTPQVSISIARRQKKFDVPVDRASDPR